MRKGKGMLVDDINLWSNWVLVATLAIGVIATCGVVVTGNIKEANLKKELSQANERTAEANLEIEKLRKQAAWRRLTQEQHKILVKTLKGSNASLLIQSVGIDIEATTFCKDIEKALKNAGMVVKYFNILHPSSDLQIVDNKTKEYDLLIKAFTDAAIPFVSIPQEKNSKNGLMIIVGSKPPAF